MSNYILISLVFALIICGVFFFTFEKKSPSPRDILPIVIMCVAASLGRVIFAFIPGVQPVTAIVIIMGVCYGGQTGFLTGALCALVSNIFLGQGPWTPWQMLAWGTIGFLAAYLPRLKSKYLHLLTLSVYAFFSGFLFSIIMDIYTVSSLGESLTLPMALTTFGLGLLFNIGHAVGNVVFICVLYVPLSKKLLRLKYKYGILTTSKEVLND